MGNDWIKFLNVLTSQDLAVAGGKGANLGELLKAGIPVPGGFCVTTAAYTYFLEKNGLVESINRKLAEVREDNAALLAGELRAMIFDATLPEDLAAAFQASLQALGAEHYYAVRSSATGEDLPEASFAGQLETYLNIRGEREILKKVQACWASLFTERAISYRYKNNFEQADIKIAVVVQKMVSAQKAGIMFTADPLTGNRDVFSIDAGFGLGEALVSGIVSADLFRVSKTTRQIIDKKIALKEFAIYPVPGTGGTRRETLTAEQKKAPALRDEQIRALTLLGEKIEAHYGKPQDIEWALENDQFFITQSRPITTLFPLPDKKWPTTRLLFSFNYIQVMMDPIRPLGQSVLKMMIMPPRNQRSDNNKYFCSAGSRIYIDISHFLSLKPLRKILPIIATMGLEPMLGQALQTAVTRKDLRPKSAFFLRLRLLRGMIKYIVPILFNTLLNVFVRNQQQTYRKRKLYLENLIRNYQDRLNAPQTSLEKLFTIEKILHSGAKEALIKIIPVVAAGIMSQKILDTLAKDKGLEQELVAITRGQAGNITTEMDLAVGDLTDAWLKAQGDTADSAFRNQLDGFLGKFGMRGPGEIDITNDRYAENAEMLTSVIRGNKDKKPGEHRAKQRSLEAEAGIAGERIIAAFANDPHDKKSWLVRRLLRSFRTYMPFREYPKFMIMNLFATGRQQLLRIGQELQQAGLIGQTKDIYFLRLPEIQTLLESAEAKERQAHKVARYKTLILKRHKAYEQDRSLSAPVLMTSRGEIIRGRPRLGNLSPNMLEGGSVSAGIVEGIAHVITDPVKEILQKGEILVTRFTDPGWTPLFINAVGLVMEVGGLMTHGSIIAREYGIPAVVGVEQATRKIKTGERIRVNGDLGIVEILADAQPAEPGRDDCQSEGNDIGWAKN